MREEEEREREEAKGRKGGRKENIYIFNIGLILEKKMLYFWDRSIPYILLP